MRSIAILGATATLLLLSSSEASFFGSDCGDSLSHNFYYGRKSNFKSLLYFKHVVNEGKFWRKVSVDVTLPTNRSQPLGQIGYMEVLDQTNEGTGGCVYIRNGGVGSNFVTFHIKSQRNYGFDFYLYVYGIPYY